MPSTSVIGSGIVDVHAHLMMPRYMALLAQSGFTIPGYGGAKAAPPSETASAATRQPPRNVASDDDGEIAARLALMAQAGVAHQLLSTPFAPYQANAEAAVAAARLCNDSLARAADLHPRKFSAFVALPLPHIAESIAEIRRGMDTLGMIGVGIQCFCLEHSVADKRFDPIYDELNRREAVLFFHPCVNGICSPFVTQWSLDATAGVLFEDTLVALHLISRKIPHRYPKIKFIIPHLGGALPMLLDRLDNQLGLSVPDLPEKPSATARRFWYDTVSHGSTAACRCALDAFGPGQILAGSDYPFLLPFEDYAETFSFLKKLSVPQSVLEQILFKNAHRLFGGLE